MRDPIEDVDRLDQAPTPVPSAPPAAAPGVAPPQPYTLPTVTVQSAAPDAAPIAPPIVTNKSTLGQTQQAQLEALDIKRQVAINSAADAAQIGADQTALLNSQQTLGQHHVAEMERVAKEHFDQFQAKQAEIDKENAAVSKMEVDPSRYFNNMSGLQKFLMILGTAANGYVAGMRGGPNETLQSLYQQQKADIDAQVQGINNKRAGIAAKENAVARFRQMGLDDQQIRSALWEGQLKIGEIGLKTLAAKAQTNATRDGYLNAAADFGREAAAMREHRIVSAQQASAAAAARAFEQNLKTNADKREDRLTDATVLEKAAAAGKAEGEAAKFKAEAGQMGPGGGLPIYNFAGGAGGVLPMGPSKEHAVKLQQDINDKYAAKVGFESAVQEVKNLVQDHALQARLGPTEVARRKDALSFTLQNAVLAAGKAGVVSEKERETADKLVRYQPDWFWQNTNWSTLDQLQRDMDRTTHLYAQAHGVRLANQQAQSSSAPPPGGVPASTIGTSPK